MPVAIEKKSTSPLQMVLSLFFPQEITGKILLLALLPTLLLILTVGISLLHPCSLTFMIPLFALMGTLACSLWKTVGLSGSYLALIAFLLLSVKQVPSQERLWQMGIILSLAIDYFIILLSVEEVATLLGKVFEESHERLSAVHQNQLEIQQATNTWEEERASFEEEISKLKEEAEQRRIEKHQDDKRSELIQSEIEMLTAQREELVADAMQARKLAKESRSKSGDEDEKERAFRSLLQCQESILSLQVAFPQMLGNISHTQKELAAAKEKLTAPESDNTAHFEKEMIELGEEVVFLEEEVTHLEELISHVLSQ